MVIIVALAYCAVPGIVDAIGLSDNTSKLLLSPCFNIL